MCRQMALRSKCFCHQMSLTNPKHFLNSALDHPRYCSTLLALSEYVVVGAVMGWFWEADRDQSGADRVLRKDGKGFKELERRKGIET